MEDARLGTTGATVSRICLGVMTYGSKSWRLWILDEDEARHFIRAAVEAGITFFDTADVYSAIAPLSIKLEPEEIKRLEEPSTPHPVLGHSY